MRHRSRIALAVPGLAFAAITLLAGCSGGASHSSLSVSSGGIARPAEGAAPGAAGSASGGTAAGAGRPASTARLVPSARRLVYTAQLSVRAPDVAAAVARATAIVTGAGGYVSSEDLASSAQALAGGSGQPPQPSATVGLKIPIAAYAPTLARLDGGAIGTRLSLQQQAQDVTQQVADVGSQVASDRAAIAQLRALLSRAGSVGDLLDVQNQINSQESDLESLEAQQNALNHETAYATVNLTVSGPVVTAVVHKAAPGPPGLLRGLSGGWHAFVLALEWLLTVAGVVAPFAAVAAVAGYVLYRVRRRAKPAP